jgi:tetratricopeptide (TPR) repeat protein
VAPASPVQPPRTAERARSQRLVQYSLLGLAGFTVVTLLALWATGRTDPPAGAPAAPTAQEQRQLDLDAALTEARQRLDSGDLQGALAALTRAQQIEPDSSAGQALRAEVDRVSLDLSSAAEREQQVSDGLILAREEFAKRRYEAAIAAAKGVLVLVPDHPEAVKLVVDSEAAVTRQRERERAQQSARQAEQAIAASATAPVAAPQSGAPPEVAPAPVPADATLDVDFYSELSEGVLTVYAGERQILREAFKFVKKTGFLSKEKIPGALGAQRTLPAGEAALRVYVTLPGKPTKAITVEGELVGGSTRRLIVRVDAEARVTASLE